MMIMSGFSITAMTGKTEIKIKERLDNNWQEYFGSMGVEFDGNMTTITIHLKDESHMHGILSLIRDLNLQLISINKLKE